MWIHHNLVVFARIWRALQVVKTFSWHHHYYVIMNWNWNFKRKLSKSSWNFELTRAHLMYFDCKNSLETSTFTSVKTVTRNHDQLNAGLMSIHVTSGCSWMKLHRMSAYMTALLAGSLLCLIQAKNASATVPVKVHCLQSLQLYEDLIFTLVWYFLLVTVKIFVPRVSIYFLFAIFSSKIPEMAGEWWDYPGRPSYWS